MSSTVPGADCKGGVCAGCKVAKGCLSLVIADSDDGVIGTGSSIGEGCFGGEAVEGGGVTGT